MTWRKLCQDLVLHPSLFAGRRGSRCRGWVGETEDAASQCRVGARSPPVPVPSRAPSHTLCAPTSSLQSFARPDLLPRGW